jgi:tetratricopeptide (TPR) repeat protein
MKAKTKNTNYFFIAVLGMLLTTYSCSDSFFDQQAGNRMNPDDHYQSMMDVQISLYGAMSPLQKQMPLAIIADGLRSDLMDITENANSDLSAINNQNYSANNPYLDGSGFYKVIISVNEILMHIDSVSSADPNFDNYYTFYTKGALIGLRSWAYFNIVKLYGEAAIIKDNMPGISDDLTQEYLGKAAMIDTLINQLTPYIHTDVKLVELYVPYYVNTKTLLGELYLEKNDYAKAVEYLKMGLESYSNGKNATDLSKSEVKGLDYKVSKTYSKESWRNIFIGAENALDENIGIVPFSSSEGQINPLTSWMLYSDAYIVKPTQKLIDLYNSQVPLKGSDGDIYRGLGVTYDTIPGTGNYYISKYSLDAGEPYSADIVISRVADLHLLLAEALNRSGDPALALVLLNQGINAEKPKPKGYAMWAPNLGIRGRAYLQSKSIPAEITDPNAIMLYVEDIIIDERAMELAYEGRRFTDLVRIAERRGDPSYLANRIASKYADPATADMVRNKLSNPSNWYLPTKKVQ